MSDISELLALQVEYVANRNKCFEAIERQTRNLLNSAPGPDTLRQCRDREDELRADANQWQKRIDAIQKKLDEEIGLTDD